MLMGVIFGMKMNNSPTFTGIKPPYTNKIAEIYPIFNDISFSELKEAIRVTKDNKNFLGEGMNGKAYNLCWGRDLVVKKHKKETALVNSDLWRETKKLDILYDFLNEGHDIKNSQRGIVSFKTTKGDFYLLTTKVMGEEACPAKKTLNKDNLSSLMTIIKEFDKGSSKTGRIMLNDLNSGNIKFTKNNAGILDFEHLSTFQIDDEIKKVIINKNYGLDCHTSDTSYLDSNLRSFELAFLKPYLCKMKSDMATKLFDDYMILKGGYHETMSEHFKSVANSSKFPKIIDEIALSEKAHARLLVPAIGKISKDIKMAEATKIQMAEYIFISSKWCNDSNSKFNPKQILEFYNNSKNEFKLNLQRALKNKDPDRVVYYKDCIKLFKKWDKIESRFNNLSESQLQRLTQDYQKTLCQELI